ncbi:carbon-nitrogen hydrolase family protein [Anatilimnocola floriformis]|uniref:carbon-nitrogen hydrolase family protein n=1 Tax=Anatilimnocola floriformis TaxID=2948575 RepID=UPI0020C3C266|nr:carbon-nitrogen hydrolase family protein [Anatilimnocola floriformis]
MSDRFRIAAAQVPSQRGDLAANLATHLAALEAAAEHDVSVMIFPELSLTGYELEIAAEFAMSIDDARLDPLHEVARTANMHIVLGAPLRSNSAKPFLGSIIQRANGTRNSYAKMHLGGNEPDYFIPGDRPEVLSVAGHSIGLAICADTGKPSHPQTYAAGGADIYAASVFLTEEWYTSDSPRFPRYAREHQFLAVMANQGASRGTLQSVGKSAIWLPGGELLAEARGTETALVIATREQDTWRGEVVLV